VAQHAALACFEPESIAEYERRRAEFKARRDFFIPALNAMGLNVPVMPDGAFYAWADCTQACRTLGVQDSWGIRLRIDEARPRGRDARARLRHRRDGALRALFHRQFHGPTADRRATPAGSAGLTAMAFALPIRIYWEDTDAGGIVFYANYLKFFERARTEWLRSLGIGQQALREATGGIFVVSETTVKYHRPAPSRRRADRHRPAAGGGPRLHHHRAGGAFEI
jgi:hypothetical protein